FISTYSFYIFLYTQTPTSQLYTLSLHDALPISSSFKIVSLKGYRLTTTISIGVISFSFSAFICAGLSRLASKPLCTFGCNVLTRSEEHTSELQSRFDLVCRLLLEKKNIIIKQKQ